MRKKILILVAALLLVVLAGVMVTLTIAETRYRMVFSAPRASYDALVDKDTQVLAVVDPFKAMDFLKKYVFTRANAPEWVATRVVPYEGAILLDPNPATNRIGLKLFINEQRLGPHIAHAINDSGMLDRMVHVQWTNGGFTYGKKGTLVAEGSMAVNPIIGSAWDAVWHKSTLHARPRIEGGHFVEVVFDNRDGAAFALIGTLILGQATQLPEGQTQPQDIAETVSEIQNGHILMDFSDEDTLKITVDVACSDSIPEDRKSLFKFLWDMGYYQMQVSAQRAGGKLTGTSTWQGSHMVGNYTLSGVGAMVGTPAPPRGHGAS